MTEAEERAGLLARIARLTEIDFAGATIDQLRRAADDLEFADRLRRERGRMAVVWYRPPEAGG
jgi:hypothetical protein